jgi:pyrrolidone-carboxylate peptidase
VTAQPVSSRFGRALIRVIITIFLVGPGVSVLTAQDRETPASAESKRPVILLTAFQLTGPGKPSTPSWDAIKTLDGTRWKEYQIVARELPALWGVPLESLSKWVAELRPVLVVSLGQGTADEFLIESVANNRRGRTPDYNGALPPNPEIISRGPSRLVATIDTGRLARALTSASYPTRVSKDAGKQLGEETLYTLEYLRQNTKEDMSVVFSHVPPLGSKIGATEVDGTYLQKFVVRVLDEWRTLAHESKAETNAAETLIRRYFKVWSDQDMPAYAACFSRHASIHSIDTQGNMSLSSLKPFVDGQARAHKAATSRMVEVPEEIVLRSEGRLMRAIVHWKLTADHRISIGYDHFTLAKESGQWKIIDLVFYESD